MTFGMAAASRGHHDLEVASAHPLVLMERSRIIQVISIDLQISSGVSDDQRIPADACICLFGFLGDASGNFFYQWQRSRIITNSLGNGEIRATVKCRRTGKCKNANSRPVVRYLMLLDIYRSQATPCSPLSRTYSSSQTMPAETPHLSILLYLQRLHKIYSHTPLTAPSFPASSPSVDLPPSPSFPCPVSALPHHEHK